MQTPFAADAQASGRDTPASLQVYETLRARIISFAMPPGKRLARSELADEFGISASPLREALQRLEREGLVTTFRQSRTVVSYIDPVIVRREHFLRTGIECEVVNKLASAPDPAALKKIGAIVKMQRVLIEDPDQIDLFRSLDEDFHRALFTAAAQGALFVLSSEWSSQMARLRSLDLPSEGKFASVVAGHEAVLAAVQAADPHAATDAMRAHLSGTIARLTEMMEQNGAYFGAPGEDAPETD